MNEWRSADGQIIAIKRMNPYHLKAAIHQVIRRTCVRVYDDRFKMGYVRTATCKSSLTQIYKRLDRSRIYIALLTEAQKRIDIFETKAYIYIMDQLCREEWSLYFRFQKVTKILRK